MPATVPQPTTTSLPDLLSTAMPRASAQRINQAVTAIQDAVEAHHHLVFLDGQGRWSAEAAEAAYGLEAEAYWELVAADRRNSANISPAPASALAALVLDGPAGPLLFLRGVPRPV